MTYPIFSSLQITHHIFPLKNSSPLWTDNGTYPHSSLIPPFPRWNPVPILRCVLLVSPISSWSVSLFHRPFGPLVSISYLVCFPLWIPQLLRFHYAAPAFHSISPFSIAPFSISLFHWLSDVEAYPESYLELQFPLCYVLYKVSQPLVCSLASSMQSSLVSSLPRFALRPNPLKAFPHPHPEWLS